MDTYGPRLYMRTHPARCVYPDVTFRDNIAVLHCTAQSPPTLHYSERLSTFLAIYFFNSTCQILAPAS